MTFRDEFPERTEHAIRTAQARIKQIDGDIHYMDNHEDSPTQRELDKAIKEMLKREKECLSTLIRAIEE
jgi:hypothetical protein